MSRMTNRRLLALGHEADNPATRFRIGQFIPALERAGWSVDLRTNRTPSPWRSTVRNPALRYVSERRGVWRRRVSRFLDIRKAADYDVVFLNRDVLESDIRFERYLLRRNPRLIFDFDDAIFLGREAHAAWVCRRAAWVTAGNADLAGFARLFTDRVTVLPTVIDTDAYAAAAARPAGSRFRLGWSGSDLSIRQTLFPYVNLLARLQRRLGFEFVIMTRPRPRLPESPLRWNYEEWDERKETRLASYFDAGIMPLTSDEFQRYKCGCKILQYMASGLPAVASRVGVNVRMIEEGRGGFLASTEEEWFDAVGRLMSCDRTAREMGASGRAYVEKNFSLRVWLPFLTGLLDRVAGITGDDLPTV